jgi:sugar phosphate isomerase/epimerase
MRLAVSNIAWPASADAEVADMLATEGVAGVEVAPTKIWPKPAEASDAELDACRAFWEGRGLPIVSAQSLLFGRPELTLFEDIATRHRTLDYLATVVRACAWLGAGPLVFGSPKNRRRGPLPAADAFAIAVEFFGRLADVAAREGAIISLEANPPAYGADFVTRAPEALELVRAVNRPGLRLHLDAACMTLAGDDPAVIADGRAELCHFHASEPMLAPLGAASKVPHAALAGHLRAAGYIGYVSVEMREPEPFSVAALRTAIRFTQAAYGREN